MAASIGAVHVEFTATTKGYRDEIEKGKAAAKSFADANVQTVQGVARGTTTTGTYSAAFGKLGEQVKGSAASIGAFSQAMSLLGSTASPAVKGLGSAMSALLAGGVTPLGIAIGATTALVSSFVGAQTAAAKSADETSKALEKQANRLVDLRRAAEEAELGARARSSGRAVDVQRIDEQVASLQADIAERAFVAQQRDRSMHTAAALARLETERTQKDLEANREINRLMLEREAITRRLSAEGDSRGVETDEQSARRNAEVAKIFSDQRRELEGAAAAARELDAALDEVRAGVMGESARWPEGQTGADQAAAVRAAREAHEAYLEELGQQMAGAEAQRQLQVSYEEMMSGVAGESARVEGERAAAAFVEASSEEISELQVMGADVAQTFSSGFGNAFASFATGAESAKDAFGRFAASVIQQTTAMIASQIVLRTITSALGLPGMPGFATGGSFTVGGAGGTDSQLVAFKATPGEKVTVSPPGKASGSGVTVNVHNYAQGVAARVERRAGGRGDEIELFIEETVAGSIARGGRVARAMQSAYGATQRPRIG